MKVLYLDSDGPLGGASRSLFEVVRPLSAGAVDPYFVAVQGTALNFYSQIAKDMVVTRGLTKFDNTRYSYYRGVRWLILIREMFYFPFTILALLRARARWKTVDVIHVNEVLCIIPGLIARWLFRAPLVVHVRSPTRMDEESIRCRWLFERLRRKAAAIIAINETTRATLPTSLDVDVIQNSFTPKKLARPDEAMQAKLDALRPTSLKIGFVGNLHHSKGLFDLLEAARLVRAAGRDVEYVIVGGVTVVDQGLKARLLDAAGLAQNVQEELAVRVGEEGLSGSFHLLGPTVDIQRVYERIDVIAFPSHFDAPGRPVFEAAFSSVPSIVAVENPFPDTLVDGETGLAIPGRNPQKLAAAIMHLADHPEHVRRMGANARKLAEKNFNPEANARKLLAVYARVVQFDRTRA
ncbi:glycosyltransferase family 4 protein [Bradyrhizobium sp. KBS0727]|uniref:glycosyltransferase family 4 protein n=1 Tax=unclassified Bradyrhizobium TaxID=2631580 RepID=UPI00110E3613|nr:MULTISPECIES: glycosyltransferase family 4 protein [unclassified Bradyrhizobium]QDW39791.1 glycosyltransferase family 4 protein [Bradyrhizobium sp. KBS0725]QDW46394.1 glycosyltransferase family 4 protein [Bradyrhizobium sp. KBS0727]